LQGRGLTLPTGERPLLMGRCYRAFAAGTMSEPVLYTFTAAGLFCLGLVGFLTRRNIIIMFLCTELMFQGVILNLVGFSAMFSGKAALSGQAFALLLIVVAAAEAALALGLRPGRRCGAEVAG